MSQAKEVHIIGAGFSGLSLAYLLLKKGIKVKIFEKNSKSGGLIQTSYRGGHLVESAANAFLATANIEDLFSDLELTPLSVRKENKKRYIYHKSTFRQLPLNIFGLLRLSIGILFFIFFKKMCRPKSGEVLSTWSSKIFGDGFSRNLLGPGLQGVYATDIESMSAKLFVNSFFDKKKKRKRQLKGSITAKRGMGSFLDSLESKVQRLGGEIVFGEEVYEFSSDHLYIIATDLNTAQELLGAIDPEIIKLNKTGLTNVCAFYNEVPSINGFGVLFKKDDDINALGVLINTNIFESRSDEGHTKSWIFGDSKVGINKLSDEEIFAKVKADSKKVFGGEAPHEIKIHRYLTGLPIYDLVLESKLDQGFDLPENIFLTGNYLGGIGLSKIYDYNINLAKKIEGVLNNEK